MHKTQLFNEIAIDNTAPSISGITDTGGNAKSLGKSGDQIEVRGSGFVLTGTDDSIVKFAGQTTADLGITVNSITNTKITVDRLPDTAARGGNPTDINIMFNNGQVNLSIKHNHRAVKHQRPSALAQQCGFIKNVDFTFNEFSILPK